MKMYEVWEGDLFLGVFYEDDFCELAEANTWIRGICISD